MANIRLKNIEKEYPGGVIAVHDFNLEITDKEFVVLVGPSGCGKSTVLRMIAGLEEISSGELFIENVLVNNLPPKTRNIAMVFQNYALYPHMTVYRNLAFALELQKFSKGEIDQKVNAVAKVLDIEHLLDRRPKALSGGQRQRVALGRAMVRDPKVFLLDEPLSNLDAKLRASMRTEIAKLHKKLQTTFVYVTHDQTEAMTMADRIVVMKDGRIHQVGQPQFLYEHPCNLFVASFIGSPQMNFLDAVLQKNAERYFLSLGNAEFQILPERLQGKDLDAFVGNAVVLGIRPEDVYDYINPGQAFLEAIVEVREHMGAEAFLYIDYEGKKITARVGATTTAIMDKKVQITFDLKKLHLFDKETTRNLLP